MRRSAKKRSISAQRLIGRRRRQSSILDSHDA
jgi:hypothetical protein